MKYGSIFKRLMALAVAFVLTFGILAGFAEAKVVQTNAAETSLVKVKEETAATPLESGLILAQKLIQERIKTLRNVDPATSSAKLFADSKDEPTRDSSQTVTVTVTNRFMGMENDVEWGNGQDKYIPRTISYQLLANGKPNGEVQTFTNPFGGSKTWDDQAKWTKLPKYDSNGTAIDYTVRVASTDGRWLNTANVKTVSGNNISFALDHRWAMAKFRVSLTWRDNGAHVSAPEDTQITLKLMKRGNERADELIATLTLNASNDFSGEFSANRYTNTGEADAYLPRPFRTDANGSVIFENGVPVLDENGCYIVEEGHDASSWRPGFPSAICSSAYFVSAENGIYNIPLANDRIQMVWLSFSVYNRWLGMDNDEEWGNGQDKYIPRTISYQLFANNRPTGEVKTFTNPFGGNKTWDDQACWTQVPKFDANGNDIEYSIRVALPDKQRWILTRSEMVAVSENSFRFEFDHRWAMAKFRVEKTWIYNGNPTQAPAGAQITVKLMKRGGEMPDELVATLTLNAANNFSGEFSSDRYTNTGEADAYLPRVFVTYDSGGVVFENGLPVINENGYYLVEEGYDSSAWKPDIPEAICSIDFYSNVENGVFTIPFRNVSRLSDEKGANAIHDTAKLVKDHTEAPAFKFTRRDINANRFDIKKVISAQTKSLAF